MTIQIIQCLQCGRVKSEENGWEKRELSGILKEVSHTYCNECVQKIQDKLIASRDFKKWKFKRQIDFLINELKGHDKKHDRKSLKLYLDEFFCIGEVDFLPYYKALQEHLVSAVCQKCQKEIDTDGESTILGNHILHMSCNREVNQKIKIVLDNDWDKSDKLDAYFDLLRIEKEIRSAVKKEIKVLRESSGVAV